MLWAYLRDRRCAGLKFRRQQPVGPFVADFLCKEAKLTVEIDGSSHDGKEELDAERQAHLEQAGFKVIRFTNEAVLANLEGVVEEIAKACGRVLPSPSPGPSDRPLPQGRGEDGRSLSL